jgi:dihydrofolate reductase
MIHIIAAVADNGVIGAGNQLPWRLPADLKRFKALTMGHTLVMGRKTFDSIGRPLPGRTTIVITRDRGWSKEGVITAHSLDDALSRAQGEVFIAGGGEIYAQAMTQADRLYITHVKERFDGDAHFPAIDPTRWRAVESEPHDEGPLRFEFVTYQKINSST